jgi:hypothetical protein
MAMIKYGTNTAYEKFMPGKWKNEKKYPTSSETAFLKTFVRNPNLLH